MVMLVKSGLKLTARGEKRGGGWKVGFLYSDRCSLTDCVAYRQIEKHRCGGGDWGCCVLPEFCTLKEQELEFACLSSLLRIRELKKNVPEFLKR